MAARPVFNLEYSTLHDAYKKSELLPKTGLGLFRLSAIPVDRPEPAEALRTTVVRIELKRQLVLLSSVQLDNRCTPRRMFAPSAGVFCAEWCLRQRTGSSWPM